MTEPPTVSYFNLTQRFAVLSDDTIVPITLMFDEDDEPTGDEDEAVGLVCVHDNRWFALRLGDFVAGGLV